MAPKRLRVQPPVQANEAAAMLMRRIVVRPMEDRQSAGIVHQFATDLDAVAGPDGTARRDVDVVHDFNRTSGARDVEGLMLGVRSRAVEEVRYRTDRTGNINPHRRHYHAREYGRLVAAR